MSKMISLWKPDYHLPYVIHCPGHTLDGTPIIWLEVLHDQQKAYDVFSFTMNREHLFEGKLLSASETEMHFLQESGLDSVSTLHVAVMTAEELETVKKEYKENRRDPPRDLEDLVHIYERDLE